MELQFNKNVCACLRRVVSKAQNQELTQEVRLSDTMPDVGRILGCWGQVLVRGKEWRSGGMTVSGGVMAWVLYVPEDGTQPQSVDAWIPFQMKWDFKDTERDGYIRAEPYIKGVDCRSISARKLMIRCAVSVMGEAVEPVDLDIFTPGVVPEDVQLLKKNYPVILPQEAGEKAFTVEDETALQQSVPKIQKVICHEAVPQITEYKVMGGKLVFRGVCEIKILYCTEDGSLNSSEQAMKFSQFTDLDRDYSPAADASICAVVTGVELDEDETGNIHIKCGLAAQYQIYDRVMLEIVEDAYSPKRTVKLKEQLLELPVLLDSQVNEQTYSMEARAEGEKIIDTAIYMGNPSVIHNGDTANAEIPLQYQILFQKDDGSLHGVTGRSDIQWAVGSDNDNYLHIFSSASRPQGKITGDKVELTGDIRMTVYAFCEQGIPMVTALELGEQLEQDPGRPSLVLRRLCSDRIWDVAKEYGSTVDEIQRVNDLQQDVQPEKMLLIPIK